jgi:FkbM family methyltransferase
MALSEPVERFGPVSRISYAQNMEDILLDRVFRGRPGTFVDIGANHPFIDNNTYFFYVRGWRGLNVEPTPRGHTLFLEHRPLDLNLAVAASDAEGTLPFYEVANVDGLTGLSTLEPEAAESYRVQGFEVVTSSVPVRTVASLIDEYRIEPPDLMSIDVESHEEAVIRGVPLERWRPKVLVVESTEPLTSVCSYQAWEPMLLAQGYLFAAFNGVNRFYLREDLRDELPRFETPVNVLDQYQRQEIIALSNQAATYRDRYEREKAARAFDQAQFEQVRAGWEWGRMQLQYIQTVCEQEIGRIANERAEWKARLEAFEQARAEWDRQRAANEHACGERERLLASTQLQLRPYRLIDRMGVVSGGYRLARNVKRRLVS